MATRPRDRRLTESRVVELKEELARAHARVDELERRLEEREGMGELLAEEMGAAALRALKRRQLQRPPGAGERRGL